MKILILAPSLNQLGGANLIALKIAKHVSEKGEYVEIWSDRVDLSSTHQLAEHLTVREIGIPALTSNPNLRKVSRITSFVTVPPHIMDFDLVNCHNFPSYFVSLSPHCKNIPMIWHCNEPSVALYPLANQIGLHNFEAKIIAMHTITRCILLLKLMDKLAVKRISRITVLSRYTQKRVRQIYCRDSRIIRMGTNLENFNTNLNYDKVRKFHEIYDRPCILTVANFAKRVDLVLNALTIVKKEISDAVLLIVGAGDDSILRNLIRKCGLEGSVVIAKNVDDNVLPFYYAACDVFVFPQPHWAWSLVTIEAMACGKPVIIPENCGVAEIIRNNYNGIKINVLNSKNLAACIINLLKDEDLRKRIGAAGRRYVELNLNEKYFLESYYHLIKNEVERSKCG